MRCSFRTVYGLLWTLSLAVPFSASGQSAFVPGTGTLITFVGDEVEDPSWEFIHNSPKSSRENDERTRFPSGHASNGRWFEGPERGQPDLMKIVKAPAGAMPGSQYAMLVRTLNSGIPGVRSYDVQQDDLIVDGVSRIGRIPVGEVPSIVTRVWLPPADEWENRSGPHFGFRGTTTATVTKTEPRKLGPFRTRNETFTTAEQYWPGIWVHFRSETSPKVDQDSAFLTVRGNRLGHDFKVRDIPVEEFGWWTMGMSFTPDGRVHYYAKPGVENLTPADHLASETPYSYRAEYMENMFYDFCNKNDGQTWSTPFVIDNPQLFVLKADRVLSIVKRKEQQLAQRQENSRSHGPSRSSRR